MRVRERPLMTLSAGGRLGPQVAADDAPVVFA